MLCLVRAVRRSQTGASCAARMEMSSVSPSACLDSCSIDFGAKRRACHLPWSLVVSRREPVPETLGEMVESCVPSGCRACSVRSPCSFLSFFLSWRKLNLIACLANIMTQPWSDATWPQATSSSASIPIVPLFSLTSQVFSFL